MFFNDINYGNGFLFYLLYVLVLFNLLKKIISLCMCDEIFF